jgi:hypothetical protein
LRVSGQDFRSNCVTPVEIGDPEGNQLTQIPQSIRTLQISPNCV